MPVRRSRLKVNPQGSVRNLGCSLNCQGRALNAGCKVAAIASTILGRGGGGGAQASFHIFQKGKGRGLAFSNPGKLPSALLRLVPGDSPKATSHPFGAPATVDLEANGMLPSLVLDKHSFLNQCLYNASNSNKHTICRVVNKAAHY